MISTQKPLPNSKCFVYFRRSQDREDRQMLSIPKQQAQVKAIIEDNKFLPIQLPGEDKTAKVPGRPIFNDMMERIEAGEAFYIAVWALSRLSRNPVDAARVIFAMDCGFLLAVYTPSRVYRNTPEDKWMLQIELANAKKNNDDLSVYVKEGFEEKRLQGQYPGPAPLGFVNVIISPGQRNIAPDPVKGPLCVKICEMAATGLYHIEDLLKEARNIGLTSRSGKPISKQTLIEMLKRRTNTGVFQYDGKKEWHQGTYEPLISVELYDKIQFAMGWAKPRKHEKPATTSGRYYPYKGILMCQTCRFNITAYPKVKELASGRTAEYVYYTCTKKNRKITCKERQVSDIELEQDIEARIREYEITEDDGHECKSWLERHYNDYIKKHDQHRPQWLKDKQRALKALEILDEKLETGVMSDERYKERAAIHTETLARANQLLNASNTDAERWLELAKETFSTVTNIGDVFQMADYTERRRLMIFIGSNWHLGNKKVALTPRKPLNLLHNRASETSWRARPDSNRRSPP
jgi:site-specific DNA recombinase